MMLRSMRILVTALLVAGCAAPDSPRSPRDVLAFPATEEVEDLRLPFDAYTFSLAEVYRLANARDLLTHECMSTRGYDWEVIDRPTDLKDLRNRRRYGVVEMGIAQQFGYHVPDGLLTPLDVEQRYDRRESGLSEGQSEAVSGANGCAHEASVRLRPKEDPDPTLLRQLSRSSLDDSQREPGVARAMEAWRGCIHRMGFDYENPFGAMAEPRWWADDPADASGQEKAVAVADVRCKKQTGLVEAWHAAEVRIQERLVQRHSDYLQVLRAAMDEELTAANAVLAQPSR